MKFDRVKQFIPEIILFIVFSALFLYKVIYSFNFDSDFGRDLMWIHDIAHGKLTLLGPKTSFGGYFLGPYYYYFFTPYLFLFKTPYAILVANAVFFALCLSIAFHILRKRNPILSLISIFWLVATPYFLYSAKNPGNAFSYIAPLFLFFIIVSFNKKQSQKSSFLYGLFTGIFANIHPSSLIVTFILSIFLIIEDKKNIWKKLIFYILGVFLPMLPVIAFEIKHNFIMFKNTFIDKSYAVFTNPENPASIAVPSKNPFMNIFFINKISQSWLNVSLIILLALNGFMYYFSKKTKRQGIILLSIFTSVFLFSVVLRFQVAFHYFFPLLLAVQFLAIYFLFSLQNKKISYFIISFLLLVNLINFPKSFYSKSRRSYEDLYLKTKQANKALNIPKKDFNIIVIRETPLAVLGYEYRYILRQFGNKADVETEYNKSRYLLVVSEKEPVDFRHVKSWEFDQFGKSELIKQTNINNFRFYLLKKKD